MKAPKPSAPTWRKERAVVLRNLPFEKPRKEIEEMIKSTIFQAGRGEPMYFHWAPDPEYRPPRHTGRLHVVVADREAAYLVKKYLNGCNYAGRWVKASLCLKADTQSLVTCPITPVDVSTRLVASGDVL
ncbi:hypothetical protein B0T11DRAFT_299471 [Plectosphaerella cucumerina]|uniref:RRM domain-containing protein n=1 Tax=Plectosphaerella cucumerina TaxID=40658 RepID=A0A8K0X2F7_9PEZI|nr:hypothetical protein B0T11DRAFT_299471 [Plectosphaerella cucumerina]